MIPLQDLNPTRRRPILTYLLLGLNIIIFLWEQTFSQEGLFRLFLDVSVVPANISNDPFSLESFLDSIRSMFFHGGWAHLGGNMLYLYLFADNIEDRFGHFFFLLLYFVSGFAAIAAQVLIDPTSTIPLVGASGAIAGVLGAYLVLFPGVRVRGIIFLGIFSRMADWPAWGVLALWFGLQLFNGLALLGAPMGNTGGVAFFAHIGGFVAGAAIAAVLMLFFPQPPPEYRREMLYERVERYRY